MGKPFTALESQDVVFDFSDQIGAHLKACGITHSQGRLGGQGRGNNKEVAG